MKKSILTLSLACILTIGSTTLTFAANNSSMCRGTNNKTTRVEILMNSGLSFEEAKQSILNDNLKRVDIALNNGNITYEEAEKIKKDMIERSNACTNPCENRNEKPNYGLNDPSNGNCPSNGNGHKRGSGNGHGRGHGNGIASTLNK